MPVKLWNALLEAGKENGLIPCGLGARDTLRLEAGMPLYGHEMNDEITPKQTGLGMFVKMDKADFIGKKAMEEMGTPSIKRCGLKITGRGIARENCPVYVGDKLIGHTTSGTHCPFLGGAYAMAIVEKNRLRWAHRSRWKSEANVSPPRSSKASFIKDNHHSS